MERREYEQGRMNFWQTAADDLTTPQSIWQLTTHAVWETAAITVS
jgi:hypothetical protein